MSSLDRFVILYGSGSVIPVPPSFVLWDVSGVLLFLASRESYRVRDNRAAHIEHFKTVDAGVKNVFVIGRRSDPMIPIGFGFE